MKRETNFKELAHMMVGGLTSPQSAEQADRLETQEELKFKSKGHLPAEFSLQWETHHFLKIQLIREGLPTLWKAICFTQSPPIEM